MQPIMQLVALLASCVIGTSLENERSSERPFRTTTSHFHSGRNAVEWEIVASFEIRRSDRIRETKLNSSYLSSEGAKFLVDIYMYYIGNILLVQARG